MKNTKNKAAHTANTKYGMGDNYGTGVSQPLGKPKAPFSNLDKTLSLKKKPRSLV